MAQKWTDLAAAGALDGTEIICVVQGAVSKKCTTQNIADLAPPGGTPTQIVNDGGQVAVSAVGDIIVSPAAGKKWEVQGAGGTIATVSDTGLINLQAGAGGAFQGGCAGGQFIANAAGAVQVQDGSGASAMVTYVPVNLAPWLPPVPQTFHAAIERIAAALFAANGGVQF
jgi:photosystem II stability/assembly factor-like uncharacterized protein